MKTPGGIECQRVRCGKSGCKCAKGQLHGPYYYYRYWQLFHKTWVQKKKYVTQTEALKLTLAINEYKATIRNIGKDQYRAMRRTVKLNIENGITGMTQRKLRSISVLVKSIA